MVTSRVNVSTTAEVGEASFLPPYRTGKIFVQIFHSSAFAALQDDGLAPKPYEPPCQAIFIIVHTFLKS